MAQERKYTAKAFGLAVEAYFRRITRTKRLVVAEPDGEEKNGVFTAKTDMFGNMKNKYIQPTNAAGEPAEVTEYLIQPTISGICYELGISKQTWSRYAKEKGYAETVERARLRVETNLQNLLMQKNSARGAQFSLQYNFGWTDKTENGSGEADSEGAGAVENMPLKKKLEIMRQMGLRLPGEEQDNDD